MRFAMSKPDGRKTQENRGPLELARVKRREFPGQREA